MAMVLATPAGAATLAASSDGGLLFTAAAGIENNLVVTDGSDAGASDPTAIRIHTPEDPVAYSEENPLPVGCDDIDSAPAASPAAYLKCASVTKVRIDLGDLGDAGRTIGNPSTELTLLGNSGNDSLDSDSGSRAQTLDGGPGNDMLSSGAGPDRLDGGPGNDRLSSGAGADDLGGGDDNDNLDGGADHDQLDGGAGGDQLAGGAGHDQLEGGTGDGNDALAGGEGDDQLDGGAGADQLFGGAGHDQLNGGDGRDSLDGDAPDVAQADGGDDVLDGGPGPDALTDPGGADLLRGGADADTLSGRADGDFDHYDGGAGIDLMSYGFTAIFVNLTDGTAGSGSESDRVAGIEDVQAITVDGATVIGDAGVNSLSTGDFGDTVDPRASNDIVDTRAGDDTIELRDGYADRASCGEGADTVQADTLDDVSADCENVTRTDVGNANDSPSPPDTPEDAPPTVAIGAPSSAAVLSTTAPNTITATATDDVGIARVIFSTGERTLCTDTTAPYSCDYSPTSADVGRDTLVVIAVDTAGQTATAVRVVNVPRFKARSLGATTSPKRDKKAPYRFKTSGKLALPAGVLPAAGCRGTVDVSFKAGKKTVSSRRVKLKSDCSYTSKVTFRLPKRLRPKTLGVVVVYGGNEVVEGLRAKRQNVRTR